MNTLIHALILKYSLAYGVDPALVAAVIKVESNFRVEAVGSAGEIGLMQLKPKYFDKIVFPKEEPVAFFLSNIELFNQKRRSNLYMPEANIQRGVQYIKWVQKYCSHKGHLEFMVCYNRGVTSAKKVTDPTEDVYFKKINVAYSQYKNEISRPTVSRTVASISLSESSR